jgi:hypothetical protein
MTTQSTIDRPATVTITDIEGKQAEIDYLEGMLLRDYYAETGLKAPVAGQTALVDDVPVGLSDTLAPGVSVATVPIAVNG